MTEPEGASNEDAPEPSAEELAMPVRGDVEQAAERPRRRTDPPPLTVRQMPQAPEAEKAALSCFLMMSREEVDAFFTELSLPKSDAEWFFFKCEGNGWKNGGKPILDWKATVRSWRSGGYLPSQKLLPNGKPVNPPKPATATTADPAGWREFLKGKNMEYREFWRAQGYLRVEFEKEAK